MPALSSVRADAELQAAVARCVADPDAWGDVMAQMRDAFASTAQTFYILQRDTGHLTPISLHGIDAARLPSLDSLYFAPDNPCMWVSKALHRPGVVRTNERMEAHLGRAGDLYRSAYYHEWLKPQQLHYMIGNTLVEDGATVANITLMRPREMPTFDAADVRRFERLTRQMRKSLQARLGFEASGAAGAGDAWAMLAAHPGAVAVVDAGLQLVYANPPMEATLRGGSTLALRGGRLAAIDAAAQTRLAAAVRAAADAAAAVWLPAAAGGRVLLLDVTSVAIRTARSLPARRLVMLSARRVAVGSDETVRVLRECHRCTRSEAMLAARLRDGHALDDAARSLGVTYETARAYLKTLFLKLDVHSQAQLVARLASLGEG